VIYQILFTKARQAAKMIERASTFGVEFCIKI